MASRRSEHLICQCGLGYPRLAAGQLRSAVIYMSEQVALEQMKQLPTDGTMDGSVPSMTTIILFALATLILTASPGPGVIYVVTRKPRPRAPGRFRIYVWDRIRRNPLDGCRRYWRGRAAGRVYQQSHFSALLRYRLPDCAWHPALAPRRRAYRSGSRTNRADCCARFLDAIAQSQGSRICLSAPVFERVATYRPTGGGAWHCLSRYRGDSGRYIRDDRNGGVQPFSSPVCASETDQPVCRRNIHCAWCRSGRPG